MNFDLIAELGWGDSHREVGALGMKLIVLFYGI